MNDCYQSHARGTHDQRAQFGFSACLAPDVNLQNFQVGQQVQRLEREIFDIIKREIPARPISHPEKIEAHYEQHTHEFAQSDQG